MRRNRAGQLRVALTWVALILTCVWLAGCGGAMQPGAPPVSSVVGEEATVVAEEATSVVEVTKAVVEPTAVATQPPAAAPTPDVATLVQAEFERMNRGNILYNPPEQMRLGQTERVEVRIGTEQVPVAALAEGLQGSGAPQVEAIVVASFMKVRLVGEGFAIDALSSEEQVVTGDSYTQWAWDVTPERSGDRSLDMIVTARIKLAGYSDEQKDLTIIRRHIAVQVDPGYALAAFLQGNRDWLFPSVVIPIAAGAGGLIWGRIRKRKGAQAQPEHRS